MLLFFIWVSQILLLCITLLSGAETENHDSPSEAFCSFVLYNVIWCNTNGTNEQARCLTGWIMKTMFLFKAKMTIVSVLSWRHCITVNLSELPHWGEAAVRAVMRTPECLIHSRWSSIKTFMFKSLNFKKTTTCSVAEKMFQRKRRKSGIMKYWN